MVFEQEQSMLSLRYSTDEGKSRCERLYSEEETDCYRGYMDLDDGASVLHSRTLLGEMRWKRLYVT